DGLRRVPVEQLDGDRAVVRVQRGAHSDGTLSASGSSAPAVGANDRTETTDRQAALAFCRSGSGRNQVGRGVSAARALRVAVALAVLVSTGFLAASAFATGRSERTLRTLNHQVFAAVNRFRVAHGLVPLRESAGLDRSARQ